jgi:hypothetical protein
MTRRLRPGVALDRLAARAARRLLAWSAARVDGNDRGWLDALAAELEEIEGGGAQLLWAVGALRLVWRGGRQHTMSRVYRVSPLVLIVLGVTLFAWLALGLAQQYALLAVVVGALTGIGLLVAAPTLIALVLACVKLMSWWLAARHVDQQGVRRAWSRLALAASALCLVALVGLGLALNGAVDHLLAQGPATAGVVASAADQSAVEGAIGRLPGTARQDVYLTTLVKPLAVNSMSLAPGEQGIVDKFASIQGFDLAHGQLPDITNFDDGAGSNGPGPDEIIGPRGRRLAASDANTYNVMVAANCPHDTCPDYSPVNGDLISVQSKVTGQIVQLRIVGQYYVEDGQPIPLFGMVLADASVVRLLSGDAPSSAYGLRIGASQRQTLFAQLKTVAPNAAFYDFTSLGSGAGPVPGYTDFTDVGAAELAFAGARAEVWEVALLATLIAAIIIVAAWEVRAFARRRRAPSVALGA